MTGKHKHLPMAEQREPRAGILLDTLFDMLFAHRGIGMMEGSLHVPSNYSSAR